MHGRVLFHIFETKIHFVITHSFLFTRCCADTDCNVPGTDTARDCVPQMQMCAVSFPLMCMGTQQCCLRCTAPNNCAVSCPGDTVDLVCPTGESFRTPGPSWAELPLGESGRVHDGPEVGMLVSFLGCKM